MRDNLFDRDGNHWQRCPACGHEQPINYKGRCEACNAPVVDLMTAKRLTGQKPEPDDVPVETR